MNEVTNEKTKAGNNSLLILLAVVIVAILAVGGYLFYQQGMNTTSEETAVATVDGEPILESEYERSAAQISSVYTAQGIDTSTTETSTAIRDQALNTLINRQLLLNAASDSGININNEAVETEYQAIVTNMGGEEALRTAITSSGITLEQFRMDLETDLVINTYLEQNISADPEAVTDEEVQAAYDTAAEGGAEGLPPFEEVSELIRDQLVNEARQAAIAAEIDRLRAEADIQVLI